MKLYVNRGHRTYEATIESAPSVTIREEGGTFGSPRTVEAETVVTHRISVNIPVGDAVVQTTSTDDPAAVVGLIFEAFEERVDSYERRNK